MELGRLVATLLCLISVLSFTRTHDCPPFTANFLGTTDALSTAGLIGAAFQAVSGDPSMLVSVQVHNSRIVCLRNGRTRDTYSGVSVIVNYTCTGAPSECTGNPILSQFEFECATGPTWTASVGGSASNIITTPPDGSLSTTLRTDCGVCVSPARSGFATITNNEQHCGSCNSACNTTQPSLMRCFNRLDSGCCNFFENVACVRSCTSPLVPNSNFDCVVDCGLLPDVTNGMLIYSPQGQDQTLVGATVIYTCNTGYTLNGNNMRTCQASGAWTGSDPNCTIVDCGTLTNPQNGEINLTATTFMSTATYSCISGYILSGNETRTCQANGMWSSIAPTCDPVICGNLTNPLNGQVTFIATTFMSTATYSCIAEYNLSGNGTRTCQVNGTWSGIAPTCDLIDCGALANPENGKVNLTVTTFMSTATYSCISGYILSGNETRTCQANGIWSSIAPTCNPVDCGTLTNPQNGEVTLTATTFMSTATYSCNSGYILSENETRTCEASGTWSDTAPTCDPVDCGALINPANGSVDITQGTTFNQVATYSCDTGYGLVGNTTRTCQADGTWSGSEPICAVDCGALTNPNNGRVDTPQGTTLNQVATYSCNSGYELVGNMTRTCQADGMWSGSEPTCDAIGPNSDLCDAAIMALVIAASLTSIFIMV